MGESFQDYSWIQNFEADFILKVSLKCRIQQIVIVSLLRFQIFWIWIIKKMLIVCTGFVRNGKTEFQDYSRAFFSFFKISISSQFCIKQHKKCTFFSRKHRSEKAHSFSLILILVIKNRTLHKLNRIGVTPCSWTCIKWFSLSFQKVFFAHPINPKGLVFYIFQGLIHIFKEILQNSRTIPGQKALFSNSRNFPRPRSNSRTFPGLCEPSALFVHF